MEFNTLSAAEYPADRLRAAGVATAAIILGVFAERWLFFIEAEQAVVLSKRKW